MTAYNWKTGTTYDATEWSGYKGSGHAVAVIRDGSIIAAEYSNGLFGDDGESGIKRRLASQYPGAEIYSGMMSTYQFTAFPGQGTRV